MSSTMTKRPDNGGGPIWEPGDPHRMQAFAGKLRDVEARDGRVSDERFEWISRELCAHGAAVKQRCRSALDPNFTPRLFRAFAKGLPLMYVGGMGRGDWGRTADEFEILAARVAAVGKPAKRLRALDWAVLEEIVRTDESLSREDLVRLAKVWNNKKLHRTGIHAIRESVKRLLEAGLIEEPYRGELQPTVLGRQQVKNRR